ncbi:MAG: hypothetical protein IH986_00900 [Planctomycetes bacterium]|nr:hypothetical protein [Planctomycetota bacterium]
MVTSEHSTHRPDDSRSAYGWITALLVVAAIGFVYWRAWLSDDAYITFRHVANCLNGHGPVFNVGERVQGYTHPLWFLLLLVGGSWFDLRVVAIVAGLLGGGLVVLVLSRLLRGLNHATARLLFVTGLLLGSHTFVEFQTSGLETGLTSLLLVALWGSCLTRVERGRPLSGGGSMLLCALLLLNRPDHLLLCGPLMIGLVVRAWREKPLRRLTTLVAALAPLLVWHGFSTVYYGTPLPNTAYAKVALSFSHAVAQGGLYARDFALHEPLHALVIVAVLVAGLFVTFRDARDRKPQSWVLLCLTLGLWFQLVYVFSIGGDFMRGRFFHSVLIGAVLIACHLLGRPRVVRDLNRAFVTALAVGLPLACAALALVFADGAGARPAAPGSSQPLYRASAVGSLIALLGFLALSVVFLRSWRAGRSGSALFITAFALHGSALYALAEFREVHWPGAIVLTAGLLTSAALFGMLLLDRARGIGVASAAAAVLLAGILSLLDLTPRRPEIPPSGIADEWAWYAGRWNDNRFTGPARHPNPKFQEWIDLGRDAAAYAREFGPIAMFWPAAGIFPYHAGPEVHVVDILGLTDAFVARCPARPDSRIGHIEHELPRGYLESRAVINVWPDWRARLAARDPTLAEHARQRAQTYQNGWPDGEAFQRWQEIRRMISGELLSSKRLSGIPRFAWP